MKIAYSEIKLLSLGLINYPCTKYQPQSMPIYFNLYSFVFDQSITSARHIKTNFLPKIAVDFHGVSDKIR